MKSYPVIWGLFHKPWHKDPVLKQPGWLNGSRIRVSEGLFSGIIRGQFPIQKVRINTRVIFGSFRGSRHITGWHITRSFCRFQRAQGYESTQTYTWTTTTTATTTSSSSSSSPPSSSSSSSPSLSSSWSWAHFIFLQESQEKKTANISSNQI